MCLILAIILLALLIVSIYIHITRLRRQLKPEPKKENAKTVSFSVLWRGMDEWRRKNSIGLFVMEYDREPTETEIKTGEINEIN